MKSLTLRASVALACALSLAACGGSSGSLTLSGTVYNLTKSGLQLQNKSGPLLDVAAGSTTFVFNELIGNDEDFDVEVAANPVGATCVPTNNKGKSGAYSITSVIITCTNTVWELGGKVSGLTADGLVLVNGSDKVAVPAAASTAVPAGATTFKMAKLTNGLPYGITVLYQPTGLTCSVQNGVGTTTLADNLDTISVTCAPAVTAASGESL
jgi:hypothetical protein